MKKAHKIIILLLVVLIIIITIILMLLPKSKADSKESVKVDKIINCTLNNDYGNYVLKSNYFINSKEGVVLYVEAKEEISSKNKEVLEFQRQVFKVMYESSNNLYGGYDIKISDKSNTAVFEVKIDYEKMDIERYLEDQIALKNYYKDKGLLDEGLKVYYESRGAVCKEE